MESLVSTEWLAGELGAPDLRIIDATLFPPGSARDPRAEFEAGHIPGAVFLDLEEVVDSSDPLPHMLPPEHKFASRMQTLGLGDGCRFVVYDSSPLHSAARAWWMLRVFGAHYVALLDGGLRKWKEEGREIATGSPQVRHRHFTPLFADDAVVDKQSVRALIGSDDCVIVDARSAGRFAGEEEEPRPGLQSGHIPGSRNLHYAQLFNADGTWKSAADLRAAFEAAGVGLERPMVTTCGSGITAAVLAFAAHRIGKEDVRLYDGSWSEWGGDPETPKATGRAG